MKKTTLSLTIGCLLFIACSKSNEQNLQGNNGGNTPACDTINMSYVNNVQPILQSNCYSCHGNAANRGGISLDTHAEVSVLANNGKLLGVITHSPGYIPMPQGMPKLSDCNISKIRSWVRAGAPNN